MRLTRDEWGLQLALLTARRGTCLRRQVGCVLLSAKGHVLSTGYNGVAAGQPHCNEVKKVAVYHTDERVGYDSLNDEFIFNGGRTPKFKMGSRDAQCVGFDEATPHACEGATAPSGTQLDLCQAIHAEQNALLRCRDVDAIETCCVTASPCVTCVKLLLNTGCQRIVFVAPYPQPAAQALWEGARRAWLGHPGLTVGT